MARLRRSNCAPGTCHTPAANSQPRQRDGAVRAQGAGPPRAVRRDRRRARRRLHDAGRQRGIG
eukprot:7525729-Alexandrium_andersonii.AAC.1